MIVKCCEKRSGLDSEPDESEPFEKFVERGGYMKVLDGEEAEKFSTKQPDTPVYMIGKKGRVWRQQQTKLRSRDMQRVFNRTMSSRKRIDSSQINNDKQSRVTGEISPLGSSSNGLEINSTDRIDDPDRSSFYSFLGSDSNPFESPVNDDNRKIHFK